LPIILVAYTFQNMPEAEIVLSLRVFTHMQGCWSNFWAKINRDGGFVQSLQQMLGAPEGI
jgi:hypothetical protein